MPDPPSISVPLPDKVPSKVLLTEESISSVAPEAIAKFPSESFDFPQFPANFILPSCISIPLLSSLLAFELVFEKVVVPVPTFTKS